MKVAIFAGNLIPFHAKSLDERPLGGTETGIIRLAEALQSKGHVVSVFTSLENPPLSKPEYFPLSHVEKHGPVDIYITVRDWIPLFYKIEAKSRLYWSGDSYDQFANYGMGDHRVIKQTTAFLAVSDWQADQLSKQSGYPREKFWTIRNGIEPTYFEGTETRIRKRLIYSSTPYRGLEHIPSLFETLLKKHPDAELHIFSGYAVYDQSDQQFAELRSRLQALPNCEIHGNVVQKQLAREMMKSSILCYPCHFEETSCITALEAQAAGCVVLSSFLGALPETVGDSGILIKGQPGTASYSEAFLKAADGLLSNEEIFSQLSQRGLERAKESTWMKVAERLENFQKSL